MRPLEPDLLYARTLALQGLAEQAAGPIEDHLFERLMCDGCGLVVDLRDQFPAGWSTAGSLKLGWTDLCPTCTRGRDATDTHRAGRAAA
jgi:hypothetical protein